MSGIYDDDDNTEEGRSAVGSLTDRYGLFRRTKTTAAPPPPPPDAAVNNTKRLVGLTETG